MPGFKAVARVSNFDAGATQFAAEAAHHSAIQAQKAVENLEEQIRALRDGVHVGPGDGRNDLPYSTQRLHEIGLRIEEVRAALQQDEAKLAQLERHVLAETRTAVPPCAVHVPPCRPNRSFGAGTSAATPPIKADSPLLDLIRPSEVFIDAVIYERDLSRVKPGDTARVRLARFRQRVEGRGEAGLRPQPSLARSASGNASRPQRAKRRSTSFWASASPLDGRRGRPRWCPVGLPAEVTFVSTGDAW